MTLFEKLEYLSTRRELSSSEHDIAFKLREALEQDKAKVISKTPLKWELREWPDMYPLDLTKKKLWSTYDKCRSLKFYTHGNKVRCDVFIWDGDTFDGHRTNSRWKGTIELQRAFLKNIESRIKYRLKEDVESEYYDHLEEQKREWIKNRKTILGI